jgi:K+ transporter
MTMNLADRVDNNMVELQAATGQHHAGFWRLTIGAIGVVYGDIGTSPLYAVHESVLAAVGPGHPAPYDAVLGILSLIIWALLLVVTLKYVVILLRADNSGEGGTLALMALANKALGGRMPFVILLGIISGGLFYGDAIITPSLSVLSAIEGIKIITAWLCSSARSRWSGSSPWRLPGCGRFRATRPCCWLSIRSTAWIS